LAPEIASRIAAGEVIERPLSALKEILENALDAGATSIDVRIEGSLDHFFAVADDGAGMTAEELPLALERHATSKLERLEDLDRLDSLGFRGEALPSIAAVSKLRLLSRVREGDGAASLVTEGGEVRERSTAARSPGTTVEVSDLFFNTPARRKFLGSPTGELRSAVRLIECYALASPEVRFRLVVGDRTRFDWPPARAENGGGPLALRRARAAAVWGERFAAQLLEAEGERDGIRVEALLGLPEHARATREGQIFIVNRRWIQSPRLSQAVRQAYGNLIPTGRFPTSTVWLTVPPDRLDVNVHPTKREVRFADESTVFSVVAGACARPLASLHPPFTVVSGGAGEERVHEGTPSQTYLGLEVARPHIAPPSIDVDAPSESRASAEAPDAPAPEPELWQLHRKYILAPVRGGLVIIDQHAAHERILYEEVRARLEGHVGLSQQLLFPALVELAPSQYDYVLELGPWLKQLGWDLSPLAPPTVVVRGVPPEMRGDRPGLSLQSILDDVGERMERSDAPDLVEQLARSYACHAATRAGDPLSTAEMKALVDRLFGTSRPHGDPHGRVTFVRLDLEELDRRFGRH
jgi:DNA mismatch repair protein MutL